MSFEIILPKKRKKCNKFWYGFLRTNYLNDFVFKPLLNILHIELSYGNLRIESYNFKIIYFAMIIRPLKQLNYNNSNMIFSSKIVYSLSHLVMKKTPPIIVSDAIFMLSIKCKVYECKKMQNTFLMLMRIKLIYWAIISFERCIRYTQNHGQAILQWNSHVKSRKVNCHCWALIKANWNSSLEHLVCY